METQRSTVPALESMLGKEIKVLDHGFIRLVDYMGSDESILEAARVSYGSGTRRLREDRGLIRYLMRHRHTTPFEMCEIKFHVKLPIFVARQWIRHRTANVNEYSARYSILDNQFYVPETPAEQSNANKQGRGEAIPGPEGQDDLKLIEDFSSEAYERYLRLLNIDAEGNELSPDRKGLAREMARMVLPTNFYTQWYWKIDLHNLFHFLSLRMDSHAQLEIREYAKQIANVARMWVPLAYEAFEDYISNGVHLSAGETRILQALLSKEAFSEDLGLTPRERTEFMEKFNLSDEWKPTTDSRPSESR